MSTSNIETLRDQFELAYATEWHTNGGRNKSTIAELAEVIKTWRNGNTYDDDLPRLQFGWEGFQWHAAATARRVQLAAERKGRIYVAGPMTGYPDLNFPAFHTAAAQLREQGWHVENPADHGEVPGAEWADYMHVDVAMLASCGAIYLLPGWSKSRGGSVEAQLAHSLGMEFHFAKGAEQLVPGWAGPLINGSAGDVHLRHSLWLALEHTINRYLMACAHGRWDGAEKAIRHIELCNHYVAAFKGGSLDDAMTDHEAAWKAVHGHTQALTDQMDEVIGFPLDSLPDYDALAPKFFDEFHQLAMAALASQAQPPVQSSHD